MAIVYILKERSDLARSMLEENGFEVITGDGTYDKATLSKCWALMPGRGAVTDEILNKAPRLRIVAKEGVGVERIDVAACTRRGICVTNTPLSNYIPVAEHTMALILAVAKQFYPLTLRLRREDPADMKGTELQACELYGKTLSLIGFGHIGARVAELANAFGMRVITYVRHPDRVILPEYVALASSMDEAIREADVLSLHVSGTKENERLIGEREFSLMKPSAIFINTTRGMVIDENALYRALSNGAIAGAGLDVFENEQPTSGNPLLLLENLFATPHTAANTGESRDRACLECAKSIIDLSYGKWPASAVNKQLRG